MSLTRHEKDVLLGAIKALTAGQKNDPFGSPTGPYLHGQYGLMNVPGSLPSIYSAVIQPLMTLANDLPIKYPEEDSIDGFNIENELMTIVTGQTAGALDSVANQPTTKCASPPKPGLLKMCTIVAPYGKYWGGTDTVDITELGSVYSRAENVDYILRNDFYNSGGPFLPSSQVSGAQALKVEIAKRMRTGALSYQRMIGQQVYTANPQNTTASQNYKQFIGLELLVNENNKRDAFTSNLCTAANSIIYDANYANIDENPQEVHNLIYDLWMQANNNADQMALQPVKWKFVMRKQFFQKLAQTWPVLEHLQALNAMAHFTNGRVTVAANDATEMRNRMLEEYFIPINGTIVEVLPDDFLEEDNVTTNGNLQPGEFSADVYLIPYTVLGGEEVTYWNFKRQAHIDEMFAREMGLIGVREADGGRTLWMSLSRLGCFELAWVHAPRLVMRTTFLAGRIQNLAYTPLRHFRDWNPASQYHADGGRTTGISQQYYGEWGASPLVLGVR